MVNENAVYSVAAMGDVMFARTVGERVRSSPADFELGKIADLLSGHDVVFLNLETPISAAGTPFRKQDPNVTFRSHPDSLQVLTRLRATVVSIGNNHMLDYGEEALRDTLMHLKERNIKYVGAGLSYEEANEPAIMECRGVSVAVVAVVMMYSASTLRAGRGRAGVADHRMSRILPCIKRLRSDGHHVIVSIHWGQEYTFYPVPYQMRQARQMIDHGASLVLGHGPHYPQGIEDYKGGKIVYSLGNFVFDEPFKYANRSFVLGAGVAPSGQVVESRVHPIIISRGVPELMDSYQGERLVRVIDTLSRAYRTRDRKFWKSISNWYFRDIIWRVGTMGSWKFILLPPVRFYYDVGMVNLISKLVPGKIRKFLKINT